MEITDEIVYNFSRGDARAFNTIFDRLRMRIFYFVKKMINDKEAAEEITSDTFVKLYRRSEAFKTEHNIRAFLYITARNAALDYIKHRNLRGTLMPLDFEDYEIPLAETSVSYDTDVEAEVLQHIHKEINKLPPKTKRIFELFYIERLSLDEIAELLNVSRQTVANQKVDALKKLRMKILDIPIVLIAYYSLYLSIKKYIIQLFVQ